MSNRARKDNTMFTEKDYIVVCHGCGHIRKHRAMFISTPLSLSARRGNTTYCIPAWGCKDCIASSAIKTAYDKGITPTTMNTFESELDSWIPEIVK